MIDPGQGAHRRQRGQQARHPGGRGRRHQRRPRPHPVRRSPATTTPSARSSCSAARSPTPPEGARLGKCAARSTSPRVTTSPRRSADHRRRRPSRRGRLAPHPATGPEAAAYPDRYRHQRGLSDGHDYLRPDQRPPRADRRGADGLQEGADRGRRRHREARSSTCARRASRARPRRPAGSPPRARSPRTST